MPWAFIPAREELAFFALAFTATLATRAHRLRSAGIDRVGWAKRRVPTIQDAGEGWWARRKGAFAHPTGWFLQDFGYGRFNH